MLLFCRGKVTVVEEHLKHHKHVQKMYEELLADVPECLTYDTSVAYVNGVSEAIFKVGMCLPAGPYVTDDDVKYIVETIRENIIG